MKEKFNPQDWLNMDICKDAASREQNVRAIPRGCPNPNPNLNADNDIETIITRIESTQTDITANYSDWRDIGFALADELGEAGRDYYHRISRFYSGYSPADCNLQYDNCLKAKGHGITLKTFFHLGKTGRN